VLCAFVCHHPAYAAGANDENFGHNRVKGKWAGL
jgi:hypothetical protein